MATIHVQETSAAKPANAKYGDTVILKNGAFNTVDENGNTVGFLPLRGGTMTGSVNMGGNAVIAGTLSGEKVEATGGFYTAMGRIIANGDGVQALMQNKRLEVLDYSGQAYMPILASSHDVPGVGRAAAYNTTGFGFYSYDGFYFRTGDNSAYANVYGASFTNPSSERFKNILGAMAYDRARKILDAEIIEYTYKKKFNDDGGEVHYGVKAEQMAEIGLDDVVTFDSDGLPYGVDYSKFTPYLIAVVQEQQRKIDDLTARLEALEAK